ncbi:MAG: hypothetical protein AB7G35_22205 [Hyphomicrobiaceae bacterium]
MAKTCRLAMVAAGVVLALSATSGSALAQMYKGKTMTMIINYPAGGPTDIEGRVVARHLPKHIAGNPTIIVKNIGGGGGMIGTNNLGEVAKPDGLTFGFFTWNIIAAIQGDPGLRVTYDKFELLAGVQNPLIYYIRTDTPPGIKTPADLMKTKGFKSLTLDASNTNTLQQAMAMDILGVKTLIVPGYRGLKAVQTGILQNEGQAANTSLPGWRASIEPTMAKQGIVKALFQIAPPGKDGTYPRSEVVPELQTFEEYYASVKGGQKPSGILYKTMRTYTDVLTSMFRTAFLPPKSPEAAVKELRKAFVEMWKDEGFISDYTKTVKSRPVLVTGDDGEAMLKALASVDPQVKSTIGDYVKRIVAGGKK